MIPLNVTTRNDQGPALLLIHGFPLDHRIWRAQIDNLPVSLRLLVPDLRGCGGSPLPPGPCGIDDYARDLLDLMTERKIDRFYVAGHSMGGYIVFSMLRQAAGRILGAALVSSRALPDTEEGRKTRETVAQRAEKEGPGFLADSMPAKAVGDAPPDGVLDTMRTIIRQAPAAGVAAAARAMAGRVDSTPGLSRIACPTVVFAGRQDKIVPPAESEAMAKGIPGAKRVWCERSGHVPMLEEPDLVTRELAGLVR
jgi:pimeloyl-ACP methyl ester carboxylesterase